MMVEFFDPAKNTREIVGPFGWLWMEGDELLAGQGREFGNADPNAIAVGYRELDGSWVSYATHNNFTDIAFTTAQPQGV
jgi:hypothetical protein